MEKSIQHFVEYVTEIAGQRPDIGQSLAERLPQYLAQQYSLHDIAIGQRHFLGVLLKDSSDFKPAVFTKHLRQIMPTFGNGQDYCLIAPSLPSYVAKRLVERKVPFVVPGHQLYWPELGLVVQARRSRVAPVPVAALSPATQAVAIYLLTADAASPVTAKGLAVTLGYTTMTMSRALDEMEANGLGQVVRSGRERLLASPADRRGFWTAALPYLRNPVRETVRFKENRLPPELRIKAGETALAALSMLVPPKETVYALGREAWKKIADQVELIPVEDEGTCRLQLWRYDPALFARAGRVDCFSLYLSLREEEDERVQTALEEIMKGPA
jgi:hypothetical protein